jgi:hypothetical protein
MMRRVIWLQTATKARWGNHFSQLLNVHEANDVRQAEVHKAQPLVPEPNAFKVEMTIENLKRHTSTSTDHVPLKYKIT